MKDLADCFESDSTKGLPGVLKIEKENIVEFRAFSPKHYYFIQLINGKFKLSQTFKGIPKHIRDDPLKSQEAIKEHLTKNQPLPSKKEFTVKAIKSRTNHEIEVVEVKKVINDIDDKRYYIDDIHTLALGHCNIVNDANA
jgi:hypothetical protein